MKIIDFHTHAFPDGIAPRAIQDLQKTAGISALTDGTADSLKQFLTTKKITTGVIMPIVTKPTQQAGVNKWAGEIVQNNPFFQSFGSIHPDVEDIAEAIEYIVSLKLKGLKLHPEYQLFTLLEKRMMPIYDAAQSHHLPILFHMGYDPFSPDLIRGNPEEAVILAKNYPDITFIWAHMGGIRCWDQIEELDIPSNVYLDTSLSAKEMSLSQARDIIDKMGTDRILFGSDCPWSDAQEQIDFLTELAYPEKELDKILYKNAQKLLAI